MGFLVLILLLLPAPAAVEVTASADPSTLPVGDSTTYSVEVLADVEGNDPRPIIQVDTPVIGEGLVSWSARYEGLRWVEGRYQYRCSWTLLADTPGAAQIAPVRVSVVLPDGRTAVQTTPAVRVTITPASGDRPARAAPLRAEPDGAPEAEYGPGGWVLVLLGGTIVLSSLAAIGWLRNHETVAAAPTAAAPTAAAARLSAALDAAEAKSGEAFWVALAAALYTYAAAMGNHTGEGLTSAEALAILRQQDAPPELLAAVTAALRQADGVRFAREPASAASAATRLASLRAALGAEGKDR